MNYNSEEWIGWEYLFRGKQRAIKIDGQLVGYNSEQLNNLAKRILLKDNIYKSNKKLKDIVFKMIDKQKINPVFLNDMFVSDIFDKVAGLLPTSDDDIGSTMGFYSDGSNKIYIFIDRQVNWMMITDDEGFAEVTTHECGHYYARNYPKQYISKIKNIAQVFYTEFFGNYFKINNSNFLKTYVNKFIQLNFKMELTSNSDNDWVKNASAIYKHIGSLWDNTKITEYDAKALNNKIQILIENIFSLIGADFDFNVSEYIRHIYPQFKNAYKKIGLNTSKIKSVYYQELFYSSEILSIMSGSFDSRALNIIINIKP